MTIPTLGVFEILTRQEYYDDHGRHTLYTFSWRRRMALPLGQGPLFNHAENPDVSFSIDIAHERIVYTSIQPEEKICIFHAHRRQSDLVHGVSSSDEDAQGHAIENLASTSADPIVAEDDLPFTWKKLGLEREEEQIDDIELAQAWVVDIHDPTHIATMLKQACHDDFLPFQLPDLPFLRWLKQSGLDNDTLSHLKRVRRQSSFCTLLLGTSPELPTLPPEPPLQPPYQLPVPCYPALTPTSLALKNSFWPTVFAPKRKWEPEPWTRTRIRWASDAVRHLKRAYAELAGDHPGELPVVAHVPIPFQDTDQLSRPLFGYDTRTSTRHPLRHAALDVIRQVADDRAQRPPPPPPATEAGIATKNGAQYLLTGLSLFITHEPCIMCTMALLHSRIKEVFYLVPMPRTGGCGGAACIPALKGVNHRFSIAVWKTDSDSEWPSPMDACTDV